MQNAGDQTVYYTDIFDFIHRGKMQQKLLAYGFVRFYGMSIIVGYSMPNLYL